jgi:hypothetical protein
MRVQFERPIGARRHEPLGAHAARAGRRFRSWARARTACLNGADEAGEHVALPARSRYSWLPATPPSLVRDVVKAQPGRAVTQMHYAKRGEITREMEFVRRRCEGRQSPQTRALTGSCAGRTFPTRMKLNLIHS